ncbi:MAG: zinc-binding dehydrogenase [Blautia sp.]|nr:zinc-binding dehydrogenase [Blautia sp.]
MEEKMKAWILEGPGDLQLREIPVPVPGDGQVLVKIDRSCSCNGSDPGIFHGHEAYQTPLVFGHEASGEIVETVGDTGFAPGDRICWWFESGAFAEYQVVSPQKTAVFRVPGNLSREACPIMELVLAACRALMGKPAARDRQKLLICGLSPSGQVLLQYARALGYQKITGWDLYESRRKLALSLGIDEVADPSFLRTEELECAEAFDTAILAMGDDLLPGEPAADLVIRSLRPGGTLISYGHPEHGLRMNPYLFQSRSLVMMSPENNMDRIRFYGQQVIELVEQERIRVEPLISHKKHFSELRDTFLDLMEHPENYMKVVYHW